MKFCCCICSGLEDGAAAIRRPSGSTFSLLMVLLVFLVLFSAPGESATKVIKLKIQDPDSIATVIRTTYGREVRVAEARMVNSIVVNCDRPEILQAIEELVRELDAAPAMLRFQVQLSSDGGAHRRTVGFEGRGSGGNVRLNDAVSTGNGFETRSLTGMEGHPLRLTDETFRVQEFPSPYGPTVVQIREERGLRISGRLSGDDHVVVEISYADGPQDSAARLISQVRAPIGQWFSLGNVDREDGSGNRSISYRKGAFSAGNLDTDNFLNRIYLLKVDLLEPRK